MESNEKDKIIDIMSKAKSKKEKKDKTQNIIIGDNNITCGDNANISIYTNSVETKNQKKTIKRAYSPGSIGYNGLIVNNINSLCGQIMDARCAIRPESEHRRICMTFYKTLSKHFGVKNKAALFNLPEGMASEILDYLNSLYANTKEGRIRESKKRTGEHTIPYFFAKEKEILDKLGQDSHDANLVDIRSRSFNVESRSQMTLQQWKEYIIILKDIYKQRFGIDYID